MAHRVVWALSARADVKDIAGYIKRDSPRFAKIVGRRLYASTRRLAIFPYSGRMIPERGDPDQREIIVYNYRVMYRVSPGEVTVFNVIHARRAVS